MFFLSKIEDRAFFFLYHFHMERIQKDVIVIGAGVAGISAGIYLKRSSVDAVVLDKGAPGGKLNNIHQIDNYPGSPSILGPDLAMKLFEQASALGVQIEYGNVSSISKEDGMFLVSTDNGDYVAKSLILATGMDNRSSKLPGEEKLLGKGISYCATCDGAFFKGKDVAVYGYSDRAVEEAIYLLGVVNHVYFLAPKDLEAADLHEKTMLGSKNMTFVEHAELLEAIGENKLEKIAYKKDGERKEIEVAGLFPLCGEVPASALLANLAVASEKGFIIANENMETSVEGLFVAGDLVKKKLRQIVTAASDGAIAATSAIGYIRSFSAKKN